MKGFLWRRLEGVNPDGYHDGGGVLVVCKGGVYTARRTLDEHLAALARESGTYVSECAASYAANTQEDWDNVIIFEMPKETEAQVYIFPDQGCC